MPDWDNTESRERDEDAAWRDLIARFDAPAADGPVPWPEREDMPSPPSRHGVVGAAGAEVASGAHGEKESDVAAEADLAALGHDASGPQQAQAAPGEGPSAAAAPEQGDETRDGGSAAGTGQAGAGRDGESAAGTGQAGAGRDGESAAGTGQAGTGRDGESAAGTGQAGTDQDGGSAAGSGGAVDADRIWRALQAEGLLGQTEPDVIRVTRRIGRTPAEWVPVYGAPAEDDEDEEHFVPPEPPPLPKLDPVTKGAWAALFGGPGYLMIATALHWSVPGYAAFCAVAAFVTGFALLVLRMNDAGPGGSDDGDGDGAVV